MKHKHIILILFLLPFTHLFAQVYEPQAPDPQDPEPDSLEMNLDEQEINDLNSGKAVVEESTVMEMSRR